MLRRIGASYTTQLWNLGVSFADRFILVGLLLRSWGTATYADWATIFAAAGLISIAEFGLNIYFGNIWQNDFAHKNEARFQRHLSISLAMYIFLASILLAGAAAYVTMTSLKEAYALKALAEHDAAVVFAMFSAVGLLRILRGSISQIYRGRSVFAEGTFIASLSPLAAIIFCSAAVLCGAGPAVTSAAYLLAEIMAGYGLVIFDLKRRFPNLSFAPSLPNRVEIEEALRQIKWFALAQGAPVAWLQFPVLMLADIGLGGDAVVGFLLIRTLINFARNLTEMLARSVAVEAAGSFHLGDQAQVANMVSKLGAVLSAATSSIAGGLFAFASPIIAIWTGKPELCDRDMLIFMLLPTILMAPTLPITQILMYGNLARLPALASLLQIAAGLLSSFLLTKAYGVLGMVAGLAIGEILGFTIFLPLIARKHIDLRLARYFGRSAVLMLLCSFWSALVAMGLQRIIGSDGLTAFLVGGGLWGAFGLAVPIAVALPASLRRRLFAFWR